ncbi:MAG: site-2 protease family protein [Acidobacteriota bacterium]
MAISRVRRLRRLAIDNLSGQGESTFSLAKRKGANNVAQRGIPIGRFWGISVALDYSWFLIVGLLAWMLAVSYYPVAFSNWTTAEYWMMGIVTAVMLFVSVLIHEFAHSLVAQQFGLPVPRITLFLFGGVSELESEPTRASTEFWIAVVGPVTSFALAAFFWEIEPFFTPGRPLFALAEYLALINLVLAIFNLIPGFPLDGGRVFRAIVWKMTGNYHRATITAGLSGRFFGFALILLGVWRALTGDLGGGIWIAFIGWFLESAAGSQLQQESVKHLLGDHKVSDAMRRDFLKVPSSISLEELVERNLLPLGMRCAVITQFDNPVGMVTMSTIREVPREEWPNTPAIQITIPLQKLTTTEPNAILWSALEKMGRDGVNQLPVVDRNEIVGMLSREDILHYLSALKALAA